MASRKITPTKIQEIASLICMGLVLAAICLPLSVYESLERQVDQWMKDFSSASFRVLLYPRAQVESDSERAQQALEGMDIFASPEVSSQENDPTQSGAVDELGYLTSARLAAIRDLPHVNTVSWSRPYMGKLWAKGEPFSINLVAPEFFDLAGIKIAQGRGPNSQDPDGAAVLGEQAARTLFGDSDPVGQRIIPDPGGYDKELTVIGVLEPAGGAHGPIGEYIDQMVYIIDREPIDISPLIRPTGLAIDDIWVKPENDRQGEAIQEIRDYLQQEIGSGTVVSILTNREYVRLVGGIQARQAYLPKMNWVIGIVLSVAALNIGIVVYSFLLQKRYVVGIKRSLGAARSQLILEEELRLLPRGALASAIGLLLAYLLAPAVGQSLQSSQYIAPIPVTLGPFTLTIGFAGGVILWCFIALISLAIFLQQTPSDLTRERNKSFAINRKGQLVSGAGLAISISALLIILGLRDATRAQFDKILGWAGGERAGAIVDWITMDTYRKEQPAELSSFDYLALKDAFPEASFGWLGRTGSLPDVATVEASASMSVIRPPVMAAGRWISSEEEADQARVAVLGNAIGIQLAEERGSSLEGLVGQTWRSFEIIGIMAEWPSRYSMGYRSDIAYLPVGVQDTGAKYYYFGGQVAFISPDHLKVEAFLEEVRGFMKLQHPEGAPQFILAAEKIGELLAWRLRLYALMGAFAGISFVIGSLGIMNIMFMWVVSHWREIGIRRACGASRSAILIKVLSFAIWLAASATFIGSLIGTFIAVFLQILSGLPVTVYPYWLVVSTGAALVTIIIFGGLPAFWASRQQLADLLRME